MANPKAVALADLFRYYRGLPHQSAAISELQEAMLKADPTLLNRSQPWFKSWAVDGKQTQAPNPHGIISTTDGSVTLPAFPYFPQLDNGSEGWRQCQTSSIAMCLRYLRVPGINDDLDYLRIVRRYGDTTDQNAHRQELQYLKVRATFRQNLSATNLLGELKAGLPVAIGILHHGPVSAPTGGGHYIACYGATPTAWRCHDPYGELDLINGGWAHVGGLYGEGILYSHRNLNPRWLHPGPFNGWGWTFS